MVFNFKKDERKSRFTELLGQLDMTVMDYPFHYEGCPLLSMEMIHHFVTTSDNWLSVDVNKNQILLHCDYGGWPLLVFIISCFLIFRHEQTGETKTLDLVQKEAPRGLLQEVSAINYSASQVRYLQYISRRNVKADEWPPKDKILVLDCLIMRTVPSFNADGGCRPVVRLYGRDPHGSSPATEQIFSMGKKSRSTKAYSKVGFDLLNWQVEGIRCDHHFSLTPACERSIMTPL